MFVVSDEDDIDGMQDPGVALVRAYNYISDEVNSQSAFEAVISVSWSKMVLWWRVFILILFYVANGFFLPCTISDIFVLLLSYLLDKV